MHSYVHHIQTGVLTVSFGLLLASGSLAQRPEPVKTLIEGDTLYTLLEPGGIPAIFEPEFISVEKARKFYHENEPLIVVARGSEVKAYSAWHLDGHEVVNDHIGGSAIAVTW